MDEIVCPLYRAAQRWGQHTAIQTSTQSLTYTELNELVCRVTTVLKKKGIQAEERVAIIASNSLWYVVVVLALLRLKAVACLIHTRYSIEQVNTALDTVGCKRIIVDDCGLSGYSRTGVSGITFQALSRAQQECDVACETEYHIDLRHDATIMFTSGTTSQPKAVLHTYGNHYFSALGANENMPLSPGDSWLIALPLYHIGGLAILFRAMLSGATIVIEHATSDITNYLKRNHITHLSLVPTQLNHLADALDTGILRHTLKALLVGGAALPTTLLKRAQAHHLPLYTTYGMTETASQVTTTAPNDTQEHVYSSGKTLTYRELTIADDGEIYVRGKVLFKGYIYNQQVQPAVDSDGWFHTGDIGVITDDGYLQVRGRKDNMFISGGENIHPEVIEAALCEDEQVEQAVVVPIPDAVFGHRPAAFIKMRNNRNIHPEQLQQHLQQLPKFMVPVAWYPFPREALVTAHKPDRHYLMNMAVRYRKDPDTY